MAASRVPFSTPARPTPEATLATYLCDKLLQDDRAMRMLGMKKDKTKAAWYFVTAAEQSLAYALCSLGHLTRDGIPNTLTPDLHKAKKLWAKAFALCDLPEAAHEVGV